MRTIHFLMLLILISAGCREKPEDVSVSQIERPEGAPEIVSADIVFIHGLGGDARDSWQPSNEPDKYWPGWIAAQYPAAQVWAVDYEAAPTFWAGSTLPLYDRARDIINRLQVRNIGSDRPVVFIVHSMGGLITKKMLEIAKTRNNPKWKKVADNTRGVIFIATPHGGSSLANYYDSIDRMFQITGKTISIDELRANEPLLRDLDEWYRENAPKAGIDSEAFYETKETKGVRVVGEDSANPKLSGVYPIPIPKVDHMTICKPQTKESEIHLNVLQILDEWVDQRHTVTEWNEVKINPPAVPEHLQVIRDTLLEKMGPLAPSQRREVEEKRDEFNYSPPDVDRFVFESNTAGKNGKFPILEVPAGIPAKLAILVLDEEGGRASVIADPDQFHERGPAQFNRDIVKGEVRFVAFVFPLAQNAYEHFKKSGFKQTFRNP